MELIDGRKVADEIKAELAGEVRKMLAEGYRAPHLAAVLVGNDGASRTYVGHKVKACEQVGFRSTLIEFDDTITEAELMAKVEELNQQEDLDGFIVQLPLPPQIDESKVTEAILPEKDADGFHPANLGRMILGLPSYRPATPSGIIELLRRYQIPAAGKNCVVLGRSNIVGTPISIMLSRKADPGNCTVTLAHSRTADLKAETLRADILIVALGKPEFVTADMVKDGAVVIDVGTTRVPDATKKSGYALKGDVKFDEVAPKCSYITPVPKGVGPMTVVSLLLNTLQASKLRQGIEG